MLWFRSAIWVVLPEPGVGSQQLLPQMLPGSLLPQFLRRVPGNKANSQLAWAWMMTVMKDSEEGQPQSMSTYFTKSSSCVSLATFRLGNWSVSFIQEVYKARAINIELCRKPQLTERRRQQRFCSIADERLLPSTMPQVRAMHARLCSDLACVYNTTSRVAP